jgi:hypothetical protein
MSGFLYQYYYNNDNQQDFSDFVSTNIARSVTLPNPLQRDGYKTNGNVWYCVSNNPSLNGRTYVPGANVSLSPSGTPYYKFYFRWVKTLTYYNNYTPNSTTTSDVYYTGIPNLFTSSILASTTFIRTGYNFQYWYTKTSNDGSGTQYNPGDISWTDDSTTTLYAIWQVKTYNITYDLNGYTTGLTVPTYPATITYDNQFNGPQLTRIGYNLKWNTTTDYSGDDYTAGINETWISDTTDANNNIILYAQWIANTFTITYKANGGSGPDVVDTFNYDISRTVTFRYNTGGSSNTNFSPPTGKTFIRWSTDSNTLAGVTYIPNQQDNIWTAQTVLTLYAKWGYTITYNINEGTGTAPSQFLEEPQTINSFAIKTGLTKTGYTIDSGSGWNTLQSATTSISTLSLNDNIILYAIWLANTYNVTFIQNFGTNSTLKKSITYPANFQYFSSNDSFSRTGYTLRHWNTDSNNAGTTYLLNSIVNAGTNTGQWNANVNITVYAIWQDDYKGKLLEIRIENGGSNYSSAPNITISDTTGSGATFSKTVTNGIITNINIINNGNNYSSPTITISDTTGTGASLIAFVGNNNTIKMIDIKNRIVGSTANNLKSYYNNIGATSNIYNNARIAELTPVIDGNGRITSVTVNNPGSGYTDIPSVTITNGGAGTGFTSNITVNTGKISYVSIINKGIGYTTNPTITQSGGGSTNATFTATTSNGSVTNVSFTTGSGYTSAPKLLVSGGTPTETAEILAFINGISVNVTNTGISYNANTKFVAGAPPISMINFKGN